MADMRIDELARRSGVTTRNIRAYRERGLLPDPKRVGRIALYGDQHLARLRIIKHLLDRGYSLANIDEMLDAWEEGAGIETLLGFETVVALPWSTEKSQVLTLQEVARRFSADGDELPDAGLLMAGQELKILEIQPDGRVLVRSPRMLDAGAALLRAGLPPADIITIAERLRSVADELAETFVGLVAPHVLANVAELDASTDAKQRRRIVRQTTDSVKELIPHLQQGVQVELGRAVEAAIVAHFGDYVGAKVVEELQ
jgi:DNA-binding transcriptional MerR regulator